MTVVVGAVLLVACATPPPAPAALESVVVPLRDEAALFQTDSLHYTPEDGDVWYEARIAVQFTNHTSDVVYFVNCQGATELYLEKQVEGK